jgi:hypothetical protein
MTRRDGGPAFPGKQPAILPRSCRTGEVHHQLPAIPQHVGMSVRDYFAAHAPIDLIEARNHWHKMHGNGSRQPTYEVLFDTLAMLRGQYADAMIAERAA